MESSGAGAHVALATPTPVPQSLNDQPTNINFDNMDWMGLDEPGTTQEPTLLHSPFNDTFVNNPFQASNVRESIDETAAAGAQEPEQPVVAPADFSMSLQDDPMIMDTAPALPFDTSMDINNLDNVPISQDAEPFNFDESWGQPPFVPEASQAVSEPEHPDVAEMNGFAQISFQDGEFLVTSTQVILGRDDKFAKKYQQEQKLAKKRLKDGSRQAKEYEAQEALHEYQKEPSHLSAHEEDPSPDASLLEGRPARGLASAYSEQGGIVGLPEAERRRRRNKKKRRNLLLSGQSSSTTSVAPANLHTFKYDVTGGADDDTEDAQKPVFLPVHPNIPADIKLISREHLQIEFNCDTSRWELKILGRSAYVKNEHYHVQVEGADTWEDCEPKLLERDEVAVLTHLTEIIVASLRMQFRLPRNKVVSTFDSDDSELSDALSSPTRPSALDEGAASDSSDEDDAPLQSIKQKKLKKQKQEERAKAGKKPVMLNLKKRKDSETSPVKARPVTPKQTDKGKRPKKTVAAGSEPPPVAEEKKDPPQPQQHPQQQPQPQPQPQPMQLHLPPAPTAAQLAEQAQDAATAQALQAATYKPAFESAPPETPASANSGGMMYTPQQPTEPVTFEPGSMLSEVPSDQLPEKRKGPGRPPKNGLISKRDMGIIRRKQKEFEKQGIPVPPLDELVRIVRAENKAKEAAAKAAARGEAPPPMAQNYPVMQSIEMSQEPSNAPTYVPAVPQPVQTTVGEGEYVPADPEAKGSPKRQRTYRSPSPMKSKEECTEEELKKPNHTYYTTLDEILSEGPPEGLELQQIYDKICKKYPYYKYGVDGHGWQSSVRHNLKQHERFQQVTKQGKGWLWAINQEIPFDKEKKRKPTPPPVQRPPMPYPMNNGMAPQQGMQQYGNPYAYGQNMHNGQTQYQQPAAQPGQQYAPQYNQNGQQPYTQPGAPQQQYVPAGSQPPANQQYQYAPQQQQVQQPQYQPNGAPPAPVPARQTPDQRQSSGTPSAKPGFNNLVDEIMAYRSDYLRPYAHLQSTPLYTEQEDVFKKCVEWISELQCNGTPQLNFSNEQERRVFGDLERIMRKYQNPAPASAPAAGTASQPANGDPNANGGAQSQNTTVNGQVNTATAVADANAAGLKRSAPDDNGGEGTEVKRMKVEGDGTEQGVSMATPQAYTATSNEAMPQQVPQTADMSSQAPAMDSVTTQPEVHATEPMFDFSNPSGPHDEHTFAFDFSTPDNPGDQSSQPVFDFSQPDMPTVDAPVEQTSQPYAPASAAPLSQQDFSQPPSNVPTPQPASQQAYSQPAATPTHPAVAPPPSQPLQTYSQPAPPAVNTSVASAPSQPHHLPPHSQSAVPTPQPHPPAQQQQPYSQPQSQAPSAVSTPQPAQTYSQAPSQAPNTGSIQQPAQGSTQPPAQTPSSVVPGPQPAQTYSQPFVQPQSNVLAQQPLTSYSQQAPSQPPSTVPTPQPVQSYQQAPPRPLNTATTPQPVQPHSQAPSQPPSTVSTPQPAQQYQAPPQPASTGPSPQPTQTFSRPPSQPVSAAPTPQPAQQYQPPSQPASVAPTPQPAQHYQPPPQPQSHPATPQPTQQTSSHHPTPSHTPVATPSMTPLAVEQAVESILPVAASGQNTPTGSGTGGNNTPAPQT